MSCRILLIAGTKNDGDNLFNTCEVCFQFVVHPPLSQSLVDRLSRALLFGVRPARPAVDAAANEDAWMTWHARIAAATRQRDHERWARFEATLAGKDRPFVSVVMTHYNRPALCKQVRAARGLVPGTVLKSVASAAD